MKYLAAFFTLLPVLALSQQDERFRLPENPVVDKSKLDLTSTEFSKRVKYIGIERSTSHRGQADYRLMLYNDGTVEYLLFDAIPGQNIIVPKREGKLSPFVYNRIAQFIIENKIIELADDYQTGPDNSTLTTFVFELDGKRKVIRIQTTLFGPPILWAFQEILEDVPDRVGVTLTK